MAMAVSCIPNFIAFSARKLSALSTCTFGSGAFVVSIFLYALFMFFLSYSNTMVVVNCMVLPEIEYIWRDYYHAK